MRKALALVLAVMCPALLLAEPINSAMIISSGTVYVNGSRVTTGSLFPGDGIAIQDGVGRISRPGLNAVLGAGSQAAWSQKGISVTRGSADIQFNKSSQVVFAGLTLRPQGEDARVIVQMVNGMRLISAKAGSIVVSGGANNDVVVPAGYTLKDVASGQNSGDSQSDSTNTNNNNNKKKKGGAGETTGNTVPGSNGGTGLSKTTVVVTTGIIVGGTLTALVATGTLGGRPSSPVKP